MVGEKFQMATFTYFGIDRDEEHGQITGSVISSQPKAPEKKKSKAKDDDPKEVTDTDFTQLQDAFFEQMHAFIDILPTAAHFVPIMQSTFLSRFEEEHLAKKQTKVVQDDSWKFYGVSDENYESIQKEYSRAIRSSDALRVFPQLSLMGLVSQFDAYMGQLLRLALEKKPHLVSKSQKMFPAHEVFSYSDVTDFKEAVVDKEVEGFLRKSHEDQFAWLKENFGVETTKDLESWSSFIEACERRNLFAHSNGIVSQQYIIKCKTAGFETEEIRGNRLTASPSYLLEKCKVFTEIGIKIAQVLSRKLISDEDYVIEADRCLNRIAYALMEHEHYDLALKLLDFGCETVVKHPDMMIYHMMVVNRANCYKFLGKHDECANILSGTDWRPFDGVFRISVSAIREEVEEVCAMMPSLKGHELLTPDGYRSWPVFHWVRSNKLFVEQFEEVFQMPFIVGVPKGEGDSEPESLSEEN